MADEAASEVKTDQAAAKPVPKKPVPKAETGEKPAAKPAAKPPAKKAEERRSFLFSPLAWAWTTFSAASALALLGTIRFLYPNVLAEPPSIVRTGRRLSEFTTSVTDEVFTEWVNKFGVWIVHLAAERRVVALSTICTHLGCTPSWLEADRKFKCPCHGSGFYATGINFEGPAPRPLERFAIGEVDGVVIVDKSKKFQAELGQWDNPESFIGV